ncbi:hypothetical protein E2C01_045560 [Portunus trituberculatus]|uniref:Uncharacterized protein n=1 Tax=Portunus trituberculatus TaxID=210409 RepID=A0A5B7G3G4_PORTR|nr:hypothetical protein [Portunus trituberculatus]
MGLEGVTARSRLFPPSLTLTLTTASSLLPSCPPFLTPDLPLGHPRAPAAHSFPHQIVPPQ